MAQERVQLNGTNSSTSRQALVYTYIKEALDLTPPNPNSNPNPNPNPNENRK